MKLPTLATVIVLCFMVVAAENLTTFTTMYEPFEDNKHQMCYPLSLSQYLGLTNNDSNPEIQYELAQIASIRHSVVIPSFMAVAAENLTTFTAMYGPFDLSNTNVFQFEGYSGHFETALQICPYDSDSGNTVSSSQTFSFAKTATPPTFNGAFQYRAGRVLLNKKFKLWKKGYNETSDRVASFNSSFLFSIYPAFGEPLGEGLAFIIVPNLSLPSNSSGQYLGLTNNETNGHPGNQFVAIELDNVKDHFDPDANHVGLDINSIISNVTVSLTPLGIKIAPLGNATSFYNVWVQYDGVKKVIEVYFAKPKIEWINQNDLTIRAINVSRPDKPFLKSNLDLRGVLNEYSYFGFSGSTGSGTQLNIILRWNLTVESYQDHINLDVSPASAPVLAPTAHYDHKHSSWKETYFIVGFGVPLLLMGAAAIGYYYLCKKGSKVQPRSDISLVDLKRLPGTPKEYEFRDLMNATNNFDENLKLGQGGFGVVYQGHIQNENENLDVAVKRFSRETVKGQDEFLAELTIINRLRHKHLVRLLGWCQEEGKLLLVYEYMSNRSLDSHLFTRTPNSQPLSWDLRYKIISGVALALRYLHNEYDQKVVHRDIKSSNIMLDSDFNARLGDFGLARTLDEDKTWYTEAGGVAGTWGYIAPECHQTYRATQKSDVYAFGVVILEIVCGLRAVTTIGEFNLLVDWVWSLHREDRILDVVDERLGNEYVTEKAKKMLLLALACCQTTASERPEIQEIVQIISGLTQVPFVPPSKPAFIWPPMPSMDDISCTANPIKIGSLRMTNSISGANQQSSITEDLYINDKFKIT